MNNLTPWEFNTIVGGGCLLAANAGFINVVSMSGIFPGVAVSHVTGSVSRISISLILEDYETLALVISIMSSFLFGCFMAGFLVGDSKFTLGAPYGFCLAIESGALFASFLFLRRELILGEWCAAFAMGLQNAMVTSFSGMAIRTTHMTGLMTDIGNILGQACRTDSKAELWRLRVHVPILISFMTGGFLGQIMWMSFREYSLLVPVFFTGGVAILYLFLPYIQDAAKKLKDATSLSHLAELGIPGIDMPVQKGGPVNHSIQKYQNVLDDDMRKFMADIDKDGDEMIELQESVKQNPFDEESRLIPKSPRFNMTMNSVSINYFDVFPNMTFMQREKVIKVGDIAIAYINPKNMKSFEVIPGGSFQNTHGLFNIDTFIGKPWGQKVINQKSNGFIYILYPTPELWTLVLPHRTQILYQADISLVTMLLDLKPGMDVIESGTGSGSFSHSVARTIAPTGCLYSFEYHEERALKAQLEFKQHGLDIKVEHRDVCKDGFDLQDTVQAVFLDLPCPWDAIESAKQAFSKSRIGRICCFSPCIEQVTRTVEVLKSSGFVDIKMFEVLSREHDLRHVENLDLPTGKDSAQSNLKRKRGGDSKVQACTSISNVVRGHTSYLTFATLLPETDLLPS